MSFNHLAKYDVAREPVPYTLYQLDGEPKLFLQPGTEVNKPYHNALLKRNAKLAQRFRAGTKVTREMLKENREHDKILYAKHVITGWEGIVDDDGNEVAFTPEVCRQFLAQLPDWIFDDARVFATNPANFLKDDEPDDADAEDTAGN
jgi:hypothetical protein